MSVSYSISKCPLCVRIAELEGVISELQLSHEETEKRFEGTVSQQTKLIDFLQAKSEAPPRKKVRRTSGRRVTWAGRREDKTGRGRMLIEKRWAAGTGLVMK